MMTTLDHTRELLRIALALPLVGFLAAGPAVVYANPKLQEVVSGEVVMQPDGTQVDVSNGSIANYEHFNIQQGESFDVHFSDGAGGNHLARVVNGLETQIMGTLTSNGHVYLANPAGILIGAGGKIDMAGFHAAAGDVDISGADGFRGRPEGQPIDGRNEYRNLTGSVRNLGEINAAVVDLVGRYVENAGIIASDPGDALNGYYVLAAGEDVVIGRANGGASISLRITGLAPRVLEAIGATEQPGLQLASTSLIDAGPEGGVSLGAGIRLGAGDLFGTAIHLAGGSQTRAQSIEAFARGGNFQVGDEGAPEALLAANEIALCAGEVCGALTPVPEEAELRADLRIDGPTRFELVPSADPAGPDGVQGTLDDEAARLDLATDGALDFDLSPGSSVTVDAAERADIALSSATGVTLSGDIAARGFRASASDGTEGGVPKLVGDVVLADGVSIDAETTVLEGIEVAGVSTAEFISTDVRPGASVGGSEIEGVDEELQILSGADLVVDDPFAAAVSGERRLTIGSYQRLDVTAAELSARELVLEAGLSVVGGDLNVGSAAVEGEPAPAPVKLSADSVELRAAVRQTRFVRPDTEVLSTVTVHDNATLTRDGVSRLPDFTLIQEASIDADSMPSVAQLGGPGSDPYARSFVSEAGTVSLGDAEAEVLGMTDEGALWRDDSLSLTLDSAVGTVVTSDLALRELTVGRGVLDDFNVVIGDVTTSGDLAIFGETALSDLEGETAPQRFESTGGTLTLGSISKQQGSLELAAAGTGEEETAPILLEGNINLENGNLEIENAFSLLGSAIRVSGVSAADSEDGVDRGMLTIHGSGDPDQPFASSLGSFGEQSLEARTITLQTGTLLEKQQGGLVLFATNIDFDTLVDDPTASIEIDGVVRLAPGPDGDPGSEPRRLTMLAGGDVTLGDSAELEAEQISIHAARSGQGDLQIGVSDTDSARLHADSIGLEAGFLDGENPDEEAPPEVSTVSVAQGVEFRDSEGLHAPLDVIIRQGGPLEDGAGLPSLSQFGLSSLQDETETMIYQVEAAKSGMEITPELADALLDGTAEERGRIDLRLIARDGMHLVAGGGPEPDLNAEVVLLAAGNDVSAGESFDLVIDDGAAIHADSIQLSAGDTQSGSGGAEVVLNGGIELRGTDGATGPEVLVISQDASIDGTSTLPSVPDAFGGVLADGTEYVLQSEAGTVTIGDATVATDAGTADVDGVDPGSLGLDGEQVTVTVNAAQDAELIQSVAGAGLVMRAGDEVLVGVHRLDNDELVETLTPVQVSVDALEFNADVGPDQGAVVIADSVGVSGFSAALPTSFALRQGNEIDDDVLPSLSQFGSPSDLSGMSYEIASFGEVTLSDASRIAGSDLILVSSQGVTLGSFDAQQPDLPLQLGSLTTCDRECETNSGDPTALTLLQSVTTQNGIDLSGSVLLGGGDGRTLSAASGDIHVGGEISYRGDLDIVADAGDVEVGGLISTAASVPMTPPPTDADGKPVDPPAVDGGDLTVSGNNVRLDRVRTHGSPAKASGSISLVADGEVELGGNTFTLDARATQDGSAGNISIQAAELRVGSDAEDAASPTRVELLGHDVDIQADVVANRPDPEPLETPEGEDPQFAPSQGRELVIGSDGDVTIAGDVTIDTLEIAAVPREDTPGPQSVLLQGDLDIGGLDDVSIITPGRLSVESEGGIELTGSLLSARDALLSAASTLSLASGTVIDSPVVRLRAGAGDLSLTDVIFASTPDQFDLVREAGFSAQEIRDLIGRISAGAGVADGTELGFHSSAGGVVVDAADVQNTRLALGAADGQEVRIQGDLDVHTLDVDGNTIADGDLTVRFSRVSASEPAAGLRASGDLTVGGDLTSYTVARFDSIAADQHVDVGGAFSAPAIERPLVAQPAQGDPVTVTLSVEAGSGGGPDDRITLLGSLADRDFSSHVVSAEARRGASLVFESDVVALGDVVADQNLDFEALALFTHEHTPLGDDGLPTAPVQVGLDQNVEATQGALTILNAIDKSRGSLRLAGASYEIHAPTGPVAVRTAGDLELAGDGTLVGDGTERSVQSTAGDVIVDGQLAYDGDLVLAAGDGETDVIRTLATGAGGATLTASTLELRSDVLGNGSLDLVANAVGFTRAAEAQRIEVTNLEINPQGRDDIPTQANLTRVGDLTLIATDGAFKMGRGEKLTATGDLEIRASGRATLSDLGAQRIKVNASSIDIAERTKGEVLLPNGEFVKDGGVDIVANKVDFSQTPERDVTVGTPTGSEISDALTGDTVLSRAIFPDLRRLKASDFACGAGLCDLVAQGSALVESSRLLQQEPPEEGPADYQLLEEANLEGVSARPLWGQELLAYLESASTGGDRAAGEFDDPRLQLPPVQKALRIYRGLFAPSQMYDATTGTRIARSHRDRIQEVLQQAEDDFLGQRGEPLTAENYLAFVATGTRHGEAMFYLSAVVDLAHEASAAGVRGDDLRLFVFMLLEDVAPRQLGAQALANALPISG